MVHGRIDFTCYERIKMDALSLKKLVDKKYIELNIKEGRYKKEDIAYKAPEQLEVISNQIKALIEVIAPLIDSKGY